MPDSCKLSVFQRSPDANLGRAGKSRGPTFAAQATFFVGVDVLLMTIKSNAAGHR
jgi:hypothetical protein